MEPINQIRSRHPRRLVLASSILSLAVVALAGCGNDSNQADDTSSGTASTAVNNAAAALVPDDVKGSGNLIVATDPTFPPSGFYDSNKNLTGFDVDLAKALGTALGLKTDVQGESFDSIIPGIQSGKFTLGMSLFNVTADREKVLDFVGYFQNGSSLLTAQTSDLSDSTTLADLCGHSVAVQRAAVQADLAKQQSTQCTQAGSDPIDIKVFPDYNAATLAVAQDRVDVGLFDQTNAAYTTGKAASHLKVIGEPFEQTPCGIVMKKGTGMAEAVQKALQGLMDDGTYMELLKKYNLQDGAVSTAEINPQA